LEKEKPVETRSGPSAAAAHQPRWHALWLQSQEAQGRSAVLLEEVALLLEEIALTFAEATLLKDASQHLRAKD
jgi:hypothetical protein